MGQSPPRGGRRGGRVPPRPADPGGGMGLYVHRLQLSGPVRHDARAPPARRAGDAPGALACGRSRAARPRALRYAGHAVARPLRPRAVHRGPHPDAPRLRHRCRTSPPRFPRVGEARSPGDPHTGGAATAAPGARPRAERESRARLGHHPRAAAAGRGRSRHRARPHAGREWPAERGQLPGCGLRWGPGSPRRRPTRSSTPWPWRGSPRASRTGWARTPIHGMSGAASSSGRARRWGSPSSPSRSP